MTIAVPAAGASPALALIVAVARNGVIGVGNALPWRLPEDLRRFRALTTGHTVIMGRKTWQSLRRALPDRQNIVVTRQRDFVAVGAAIATSLPAAMALVRMPAPAFCIGGAELYALALPEADRMYVTEIARDVEGDASFPPFDRALWRETARESRTAADGLAYAYVTYERVRAGDWRRR